MLGSGNEVAEAGEEFDMGWADGLWLMPEDELVSLVELTDFTFRKTRSRR